MSDNESTIKSSMVSEAVFQTKDTDDTTSIICSVSCTGGEIPNFALSEAPPSVLKLVPLSLAGITPPQYFQRRIDDCVYDETDKISSVGGKDISLNQEIGMKLEENQLPGEPRSAENSIYISATKDSSFPEMVDFGGIQERKMQIVRSWLAKRYSSNARSGDEIIDTLLRLAEDRMYVYGFYERFKREESMEERRAARRKRGRAWEEAHTAKRRKAEGIDEFSASTLNSFAFMRWHAAKGYHVEASLLQCESQPVDSTSILTIEERQMFARYALSSGKLRKECADPYVFLTSRLMRLRHNMENEIINGPTTEQENKEPT